MLFTLAARVSGLWLCAVLLCSSGVHRASGQVAAKPKLSAAKKPIHFPEPAGAVSDFAGVLTDRQEDSLAADILRFNATYDCRLAMATMDSAQTESDEYLSFFYNLRWYWGISDGAKDGRLLITLIPERQRMRISSVEDLAERLTVAEADEIIREVRESMQEGNSVRALYGALKALGERLKR